MKNIIEDLGEVLSELVGAAAVFAGLFGALVLFKDFADAFISYFI